MDRLRRLLLGLAGAVGALLALFVAFAVLAGVLHFFTAPGRDATGQVSRPGEVFPWELKAGDCFDRAAQSVEGNGISLADVVPCTSSHHYEVIFADRLSTSGFPTDADLRVWMRESCAPAYLAYVGQSLDETTLQVYTFSPTGPAWKDGGREVQCTVADPNGNAMTASVRGSGR